MKRFRLIVASYFAAAVLAGCGGSQSDPKDVVAPSEGKARVLAVAGGQTSAVSSLSVQSLVLKAERRIGRTLFEYDYQVLIQNQGQTLTGVSATLVTVGAGTTIVDGQVNVGAIAAGSTVTPGDTITLRHDRSRPFELAALAWQFSADPVEEPSTLTLALSSTLDDSTVKRVNQIITAGGAITVSVTSGVPVAVPISSATPLVLATDVENALVLATLASEPELSESSTAIALLWLWMKPIAGNGIEDRGFPAIARRAKGFERLVASVRAALLAGTGPASTPAVLFELNQVAYEVDSLVTNQVPRMRPLGVIATPRLQGSLDLLHAEDFVTGNIFVNAPANTSNVGVFNGTALYWSAYTQTYDGRRLDKPDLLKPVTLSEAGRYQQGSRPSGEYQEILGDRVVAYDLTVLQDKASRRANATMIMRNSLGALLGTAALAFGDSAACLNEFISAVAPTELDAVAAGADPAAVHAYTTAFRLALATNSLSSITLSATCTGGATLLARLARHMELILAGLKLYNDAFSTVNDAGTVGESAGTWIVLAQDFADAIGKSRAVGVCVAGGVVKPCAVRYELAEAQPWIEGARGKLTLSAFALRDVRTLVPSTLRISSTNMFPSITAPDQMVQMLRTGEIKLGLMDEPTGYTLDPLTIRVEPGQVQYTSFLGSATSGPLRVDEVRELSVVANSNVSQFQGDVDFTFRVAAGGESVIELFQVGQRTASVKGLRAGTAVVYAVNAVTRRELSFEVVVQSKAIPHTCQQPSYRPEPPTCRPPGVRFRDPQMLILANVEYSAKDILTIDPGEGCNAKFVVALPTNNPGFLLGGYTGGGNGLYGWEPTPEFPYPANVPLTIRFTRAGLVNFSYFSRIDRTPIVGGTLPIFADYRSCSADVRQR